MMLPYVWAPFTWMRRLSQCLASCRASKSARFTRMQASSVELSSTSSMSSPTLSTTASARSASTALVPCCTLLSRMEQVIRLGCRPQAFISRTMAQAASWSALMVASSSSLKVTQLGCRPAWPIAFTASRAPFRLPTESRALMMVLYVTTSAVPSSTASVQTRSAAPRSSHSTHASSSALHRQTVRVRPLSRKLCRRAGTEALREASRRSCWRRAPCEATSGAPLAKPFRDSIAPSRSEACSAAFSAARAVPAPSPSDPPCGAPQPPRPRALLACGFAGAFRGSFAVPPIRCLPNRMTWAQAASSSTASSSCMAEMSWPTNCTAAEPFATTAETCIFSVGLWGPSGRETRRVLGTNVEGSE
mmetsp:Transcript_44815/g.107104  ORF Transcript_44815/g.107104 Transcript_44815/m.107104 type:complete len:361 (+) Transcript_44815:461-1543(+)